MTTAPIQIGDRFRSHSGCIYRVDHIQPVIGCFVTAEGENEQTIKKHRELRQMRKLAPPQHNDIQEK